MAPQQPKPLIGGYEPVRLLGRGGMGEVWLASDARADRMVALKLIKPGYLDDPAMRTRFLNEARTLGRLEQDRIVTLYNVVEDETRLALVLRFIDGNSLADRIDSQGALPLDFVAASVRDIVPALGFAHERGIIHRDIKPQNVLVDRQGRSFLTDFGIAVAEFAERGTMTGFSVGTPHYMSPEQIQTPRSITVQSRGHRSDIYSYGVVMYEMLTGRVPFCGDSGVEEIYKVQHAHCVEPPKPLREVNPSVPPAVEALVLRCLEKNPDRRPQTCAELLDEFNAAMEAGPSAASARRSATHAATVLEPRGQRPDAAPAVKPQPPAPEAPRRPGGAGLPKWAWLGAGTLLIAGGISYAVITLKSPQPQTQKSEKTNVVENVKPPQTPPTDQSLAPNVSPTKKTDETLGRNGTPRPLPDTSRRDVQPPANKGTTTNLVAERDYTQSADLLSKRQPCEALDVAKQAVQLDPSNQKYALLQSQASKACDVVKEGDGYYAQAQEQFKQGNYCEGKSAIDEALKRAPSNAAYIELQRRLAKGCTIQ